MALAVRSRNAFPVPAGMVRSIAGFLAVAAMAELLLLRSGTRTAIHIPALEALQGPYEVFSFAARYAFFVSVTLLVAALGVVGTRLWSAGRTDARVGAIGLATFAVAAIGLRTGIGDGLAAQGLATCGVVLAGGAAVAGRRRSEMVVPALFVAGFLAAAAGTLVSDAGGRGIAVTWDVGPLIALSELLGVAALIVAPFAFGVRRDRGAVAAAAAVGILVFAIFVREPATSRFLLLWNAGMSGGLPGLAYAGALAGMTTASIGLLRRGRLFEAAAIPLLVAGGLGLHSTYQTGLVAVAFGLLALATAERRSDGFTGKA